MAWISSPDLTVVITDGLDRVGGSYGCGRFRIWGYLLLLLSSLSISSFASSLESCAVHERRRASACGGFTMEVVYFRTDTSRPVGFCNSDGRIDFSALGGQFRLDPSSIMLNGIKFSDEGLQSRDTWTVIINIFRQKGLPVGTKEDPVVVTGEAPVPTAGQATPEQDDRFEKLLERFGQRLTESFEWLARKKSYRISEADSTVINEILSSVGGGDIRNVGVLFDATKHIARDLPAFKWGDSVESAQAGDYVKYIKEYLVPSNQKWSVINGNHHPDLLDGNLGENGEGPEFEGTTDVAVVEKVAEDLPKTGLKMIFELKKVGKIDERAHFQTIVSVLLANSFCHRLRPTFCHRLRPVGMLSDLVDVWKFFWIEDSGTVYRHLFPSRSEAVGFLDAFLKGDSELEDDSHVTSALRRPGESSSRGVKRKFQGSHKFSTPELERLEELTGLLPEDELRQSRAAIALKLAMNIPALHSVVSDMRESPTPWPEGMYT